MFSIPTETPTDWLEVLLLPAIALFFGAVIYLVGEFNVGDSGRPKKWKWLGVGILVVGALLAYRYFIPMISGSVEAFAYRELLRGYGRKMIIAHWFSFLAPVVTILLALLISWRHGKRLVEAREEL